VTMIVKTQLFASFREAVGSGSVDLELGEPPTVGELLESLRRAHPQLGSTIGSALVAVNLEYVGPEFRLSEGDKVAIIPPVSGGGLA
jgi:molybdopterin converting factor subunit 1